MSAVSHNTGRCTNSNELIITRIGGNSSANKVKILGGASFGNEVRLTNTSFDMLTAPNAGGFFVGDYEGMDTSGTTFRPFFVLANSGNTSNRTDVFTRSATP